MVGNLEMINTDFTLYNSFERYKYCVSFDLGIGIEESGSVVFYHVDKTNDEELYEYVLKEISI